MIGHILSQNEGSVNGSPSLLTGQIVFTRCTENAFSAGIVIDKPSSDFIGTSKRRIRMRNLALAAVISVFALAHASVSSASDLLVGSDGTNSVLRYDGTDGSFIGEFVASGSGGLSGVDGFDFGPDGNFYVLDYDNARVLRYNGTGDFLDVFLGSGASGEGLILGPDGRLYAGDFNNGIVRRADTSGVSEPFVSGAPDVDGLAFGPDGNLYAVSSSTDSVFRYDGATGDLIDEFVAPASGGLDFPIGLAFGPDGNLYVASAANDNVLRYDGTTGAFLDVFVAAGAGGLAVGSVPLFGPDGNLYVTSYDNDRVLRYDGATGDFLDTFVAAGSGGLDGPLFLKFMPAGSLQFSAANFAAGEGEGAAAVTVERSGGANGEVTVQFATSNGTAVAGSDYVAQTSTLIFADGETSKTVTVTLTDDASDEADETVNLTLSLPTGGASLGDRETAVLTIADDDATPPADGGGGCSLVL